jgi:hypothetical protein
MKIAVTGMLIAASLAGITTPVAHADCGDPGQDPCTGPVPAVDQVVAVMAEMTDPAADRSAVISPGLNPEETATANKYLTAMSEKGLLPLSFVVTNIQPAPNNLAGATVATTGDNWHQRSAPGSIILVNQGGRWLITHDTARATLEAIFTNATRRVGPGAGSMSR